MKPVPAGTVNVDVDYTGVSPTNTGPFTNASSANVTIPAFSMGESEVTYELWRAVYDWAVSRGYTFANAGRQGGKSGGGLVGNNRHPVTTISWRDAVVWCNAYSEAMGRAPVYYFGGAVLRQSEGNSVAAGNGKADKAVINPGNGYRLPSSAQWEYAARGGVPSAGTPWTYTYAGSNTVGDVAVYNTTQTATVKSKAANSRGLYDMTGNVWEWCQDLYSDAALFLGGGWSFGASDCKVSSWGDAWPYGADKRLGFRVVCP
jgi:formylglycine-generating enzyme required for sulfatase activity